MNESSRLMADASMDENDSLELGGTVSSNSTIEHISKYWNRQPCNIKHSKSEYGTKLYFDEVETRKYFVEPHIKNFATFGEWSAKRVLEIGCGIGTDAINFVRAGAIYTGIELSTKSLEITKKRFEVYGLQPEALLEGNAEELDKIFTYITDSSKQFDLIYSFGVIHHTPRPRRVLEQIIKLNLLKEKTGELRIMVYAARSWKAAMITAGLDQPEAQNDCPIAYTYTNESVCKLMTGLFEIKSIEQDHIFPYVIEKYRNHEYERQPYFSAMPNEIFRALEKVFGWHLLVTATKTPEILDKA